MSSIRVQKVEELLRELVSNLIREQVPEEHGMITVTDTEVTADLKSATIFVALMNKTDEQKVISVLNKLAPDFQRELGKSLALRYTPRLIFKIDVGDEKIGRIEEILKDINEK